MKKFIFSATVAGGLAVAALGLAGVADAETGSATDIVAGLRAEGYSVQINGVTGDLTGCTVSGVNRAGSPNAGGTVYVDAWCSGAC